MLACALPAGDFPDIGRVYTTRPIFSERIRVHVVHLYGPACRSVVVLSPMERRLHMKVRDAMSRDVRVASPEESIRNAARLMVEIDVGALPVGENDRLIGVITDRDIAVRAVAEGKAPTTKVREVMSREVLYCYDDQSLDEIARNMAEVQVRRLPVVDRDKRLVGIIALGDLARNEDAQTAGATVADISKPGGEHSQTH
jgi:CBS domain-containing protein